MPCRTDCAHSVPVRARRCLLAHRGSCDACRDFVSSELEREPTDHPWIVTTNKYYKRSKGSWYDKGIITMGVTYIYHVDLDSDCYSIKIDRDDKIVFYACLPKGMRYGAVTKLADAVLRHMIASDAQQRRQEAV